MSHLRLFIAFDSPPDVKSKAAEIQDELRKARADVSWERTEKLHCTIKFLGETTSELVPSVVEALTEISRVSAPFSVRYHGTGCFPDRRAPRVLWLGIENPDGNLDSLFQRIDSDMTGLGYKPENRHYHPHLTLGRVRSARNQSSLLGILENVTFESALLPINEILLIKSELRPTGSVYTKINFFSLVGNSG